MLEDVLIFRLRTPVSGSDEVIDEIHAKIVEQIKTGIVVLPAKVEMVLRLKRNEVSKIGVDMMEVEKNDQT